MLQGVIFSFVCFVFTFRTVDCITLIKPLH